MCPGRAQLCTCSGMTAQQSQAPPQLQHAAMSQCYAPSKGSPEVHMHVGAVMFFGRYIILLLRLEFPYMLRRRMMTQVDKHRDLPTSLAFERHTDTPTPTHTPLDLNFVCMFRAIQSL